MVLIQGWGDGSVVSLLGDNTLLSEALLLPIYMTYSISLHQMVLLPFESAERKPFPAFGKEEEEQES